MKYPCGLGIWIAFHEAAHKNTSWFRVCSEMASCGVRWLAIRTGEHTNRFMKDNGPFGTQELQSACVGSGIGLYSWAYSYPKDLAKQVDFIRSIKDSGFEGHIVDAEIEWTGQHRLGEEFVSLVNAELEDYYVAHAPLAWQEYHPQWPYKQFEELADTHPQLYWTELRRGKYEDMLKPMAEWEKDLPGNPLLRVSPIGCTYGNESAFAKNAPGKFFPQDLDSFLDRAEKFYAHSLYSWEAASPQAKLVLERRFQKRQQELSHDDSPFVNKG